mmetsp:Transcript_90871/g.261853  ORF Transcript_90871/g.261853 Transcript_90871/m.261853 type:complete len:483 (-) Transcript_90871:139-1587(-)
MACADLLEEGSFALSGIALPRRSECHEWRRTVLFVAGAAVVFLAVVVLRRSQHAFSIGSLLVPPALLAVACAARSRRSMLGWKRPSARRRTLRHACSPPVTQAIEISERGGCKEKRKVAFSRVSYVYFRDLTMLSAERKAEIWWQPEDFDAFLSVRVEIGKAYRAAAKKLGLDIMQVSSVGSHGDEGYRAMISINSKLCGESRRGLGLGRKRSRAKTRDAYIAAVLNEQLRQQKVGEFDPDKLAVVARAVSKKDQIYAHNIAQLYYDQDREVEQNEDRERLLREAELRAQVGAPQSEPSDDDGTGEVNRTVSAPPEALFEPPPLPPRINSDLAVVGNDEFVAFNDEDTFQEMRRKISPQNPSLSAKGFGLSVDRLREAGLNSNGHSISRYQKLRKLGRQGSQMADETESDGTACETEVEIAEDDDGGADGEDSVAIVAEYRQWRMGAPVRAGLPGFSEVKTYGTRKEYRAWRAWQKPPDKAA